MPPSFSEPTREWPDSPLRLRVAASQRQLVISDIAPRLSLEPGRFDLACLGNRGPPGRSRADSLPLNRISARRRGDLAVSEGPPLRELVADDVRRVVPVEPLRVARESVDDAHVVLAHDLARVVADTYKARERLRATDEPRGRVEETAGDPVRRGCEEDLGTTGRREQPVEGESREDCRLPFLRGATITTLRHVGKPSSSKANASPIILRCHGSRLSGFPSQRSSLWTRCSLQNFAKWSTSEPAAYERHASVGRFMMLVPCVERRILSARSGAGLLVGGHVGARGLTACGTSVPAPGLIIRGRVPSLTSHRVSVTRRGHDRHKADAARCAKRSGVVLPPWGAGVTRGRLPQLRPPPAPDLTTSPPGASRQATCRSRA